ncbi:GH36-type glycosyl hydrolase domain-containing protein [Clostridium algidicarnis]|uniref:GH36-type glycosyl hydrolase domain-containing protein n=1 Tax=Clostridium algidicarnis TaxID=37659 RepID=UPI001C0BA330|nr:glucoamylase family protein [Clostridium algidicarnis]MBU3227179.1 cyclic beta 1-2 glucan synthetase [Clostridium algidicarnis]MBU3250704.1 cyclic beta 1-2 glucan synthetase [Clostridium algidicarnis]
MKISEQKESDIMTYIFLAVGLLLALLFTYLIKFKNGNENQENIIQGEDKKEDLNCKDIDQLASIIANNKIIPNKRIKEKRLMNKLNKDYKNIIKNYEMLKENEKTQKNLTGAAEWLLDNIYVIEKEYETIKYNIPKDYCRYFPIVENKICDRNLRVYYITKTFVDYFDNNVNRDNIEDFLISYESYNHLSMGELWSFPLMLRMVLIESISKDSSIINKIYNERRRADIIIDKLILAYTEDRLKDYLEILKHKDIPYSDTFINKLVKSVKDNGLDQEEIYLWIEEKYGVSKENIGLISRRESIEEANLNSFMGNAIISLKNIESKDWKCTFEKISYVEKTLSKDPLHVYTSMDFSSRDYYRHELEKIARKVKVDESQVVDKVLELSEKSNLQLKEVKDKEIYKCHVGYYIIDKGARELKECFINKNSAMNKLSSFLEMNKFILYISFIISMIAISQYLILYNFRLKDLDIKIYKYVLGFMVFIIPLSEIVISIFHWIIIKYTPPKFVPKIEFKESIPKEYKTMVVIPTLINNETRGTDLIKDLEVYYLASRMEGLCFGVLGDFKDSKTKEDPKDNVIIETMLKEIKRLNKKYSKDEDIFYFFNRYRQYNEKEDAFIGWERKRGKLMEFNYLLRGDENTSYDVISGDISKLQEIKYVITLDADTKLPMGTAKGLIGAMAHVLNKPYVDASLKKVVRGYGLMQPRITVSIEDSNRTIFSKIFSGETGIDTYTTAVSDVYQDLFYEGIFTGKGIYDVDVFNEMLMSAIPENTVLSHDLLEGSYVRCALVTDLQLVDGYPAYYNSSILRLHRWARGDFQLLPWIYKESPINSLSRWKIIDNLRRSLITPSIIILFLYALALEPGGYGIGTAIGIISMICPILFNITDILTAPLKSISIFTYTNSFKRIIKQVILTFAFIPYQGYIMMDAMIRTLYRLFISKKNLLQWKTAEDVESKVSNKIIAYVESMAIGSIVGIIILYLSYINSKEAFYVYLVPSLLWILSPIIAYYISKEINIDTKDFKKEEIDLLKNISRRTWAYFEDFINEESNWLAPDNFQQEPSKGLACRTSPTNIGMVFTSNISAYDLGYIGIEEVVNRMYKSIHSVMNLEKYQGHLYNWYDTKTLKALYPRYVSTVDSGNLVACLWIVPETLKEYLETPLINKNSMKGLEDTIKLLLEDLEKETIYFDKNLDFTSYKSLKDYKDKLRAIRDGCFHIEKEEGDNYYWNKKLKSMVNKRLKELQDLLPFFDTAIEEDEALSNELMDIVINTNLKDLPDILNNFKSMGECSFELEVLIENSIKEICRLINKIKTLILNCEKLIKETDFKMLYDESAGLFYIGYNLEEERYSDSYYDLLASESRIASYVAIAKGDIEYKHWFKLGRSLRKVGKNKVLMSWSGTMFEYLMPLLLMKSYSDTLLAETYKGVVESQKDYAKDLNIPFGISESAYFKFDLEENFQYKAFGVPSVGLKRGIEDDIVISPYSTVMALMVDFRASIDNIKSLISMGMLGKYGLYEALDYTKERIPKGKERALVKSYMVHHQGMSFMALNNIINKDILQNRFHNIPEVKSIGLLLQEKPINRIVFSRKRDPSYSKKEVYEKNMLIRRHSDANTKFPEVQVLSNGDYSLMITNDGSGYGKEKDMMLYRWREDPTTSIGGQYFYIKNLNSNEFWSATYEPCKHEGEEYEAIFSLDKAQYRRKDGNILTKLDVSIASYDNMEIRKLIITNNSDSTRYIEVTSYMEVTLSTYEADVAHPSFSNLFINTEYIEEDQCILASRRPRSKGEKRKYLANKIIAKGDTVGALQYETNRLNFIGRNRNLSNPYTMESEVPLKNTVGYVLDPIISLRRVFKIKKGHSAQIAFITSVSDDKEDILDIVNRYKTIKDIDRAFNISNNEVKSELRQLGITSNQANLYQILASKIIFLNDSKREREEYLKGIKRSQKNLWSYGISGDYPIVLVKVSKNKDLELVTQVLMAYKYLNKKAIKFDCIILNEEDSSYDEPLQKEIKQIIGKLGLSNKEEKPAGIFVKGKHSMEKEDINLILGIAKFIFYGERGNFNNNIKERIENKIEDKSPQLIDNIEFTPKSNAVSFIRNYNYNNKVIVNTNSDSKDDYNKSWNREIEGIKNLKWIKDSFATEFSLEISKSYDVGLKEQQKRKDFFDTSELLFFNGIGGFHPKRNSYIICLKSYNNTPAPWINILSNREFGCFISESGSAHTWNKNSRENKITPWSNDSIIDPAGEAFFLRDNDEGNFWSITPGPVRDSGEYIIEHGFGYSKFTHSAYDVDGSYTVFVDKDNPIKYIVVTLKNTSNKIKNISSFYYSRMVLGESIEKSSQYVYTKIEEDFIWARNPYSEHFGGLKAFLKIVGGEDISFTGNRREFIGKGGAIEYPLAMKKENLSNTEGAGFDPCLSQCSKIKLNPLEEKTIVIALGQLEDIDSIRDILDISDTKEVEKKLDESKLYWEETLGKIKVETPDNSMDIMLNGWLMYQTLCCRYWARTAFYQSGGAYGFRDQLQDSMAIGLVDENITRDQILRSAGRQYIEGDVQHWWHPVINSGIRTRFSDDLLWLPFVTADYINHTGDLSILDENVPYLKDEPLKEGEDERYNVVMNCDKQGSIYEHCLKAIDKGLNFGPHNIPLIGSGDWNDGFSTVGNKGTGESVWLGWFLYYILEEFIEICNIKKDEDTKRKYSETKKFIRENLEKNAWDGAWYRRAYFDDGTPLGSIENSECTIDSISQSWSVISGAADIKRAKKAMNSVEKNLIKKDKGMIVLLSPPFNKSSLEPGYIKGYIPGVRENGGQYTHAAVWVILAMCKLNYNSEALKLFNMINPINHTLSITDIERYKAEPYVMTADIYSLEPYEGRGGWSWYTGASGWMYKTAVEDILGLKIIKGRGFIIKPCVPIEWNEYKITYKKDKGIYNIVVKRDEKKCVLINDVISEDGFINFKEGEQNIVVYI